MLVKPWAPPWSSCSKQNSPPRLVPPRSLLITPQFLLALLFAAGTVRAEGAPAVQEQFKTLVAPFFKTHCIRCHGEEKNEGKVSLDKLTAELTNEHDLELWQLISTMLKRGEMPPEDEPQPSAAGRKEVITWIEASLRTVSSAASPTARTTTTRRLTNFEYQNTMRDLLGFELKLAENLPEDPVKPYKFNNTAEYMLIGPEQMDRYRENARRALASAIVDPTVPEVHRTVRQWEPSDTAMGLGSDEIGVYGNRRNTPATGMGIKSWPQTGEYRIRIKAAAIMPPGVKEVPLRLVMGYGLNENLAMLQIEPVGTVHLKNNVDELRVFEFRGRIENHPIKPGQVTERGTTPPSLTITPQNLYDDGTLNDENNFQNTRSLSLPRAVISSLEFEAPVVDVWPPAYHTRILFKSPLREKDPAAYVREVLKQFMTRAFRRPVTAAELEHFVKMHNIFAAEFATLEEALRETLSMVLISPQFLYHTEAKVDKTVRHYELASKLSYFLWGSMPDDELLALAEQQKLADPSVIEQQTRRLLADKLSAAFIDNFTTQWLSIAKMKSVKINETLFPRFLYLVPRGERTGTEEPYRPTIRDFMHAETVGFVGELIKRNASVMQIVDSDFAMLNQPLAAHYGVEGVHGQELRPVQIKPEHHLGGLLTHGSVLIGNGTGSAPHPIYRAVWLREAILGSDVKPPPADVPALSDTAGDAAEKAVTIKDLLRNHRQKESCNACHARLDPWGIPFEQYNAIGKFQPRVPKAGTRVRGFNAALDKDLAGYASYLESIHTVPVSADTRLPRGTSIDGMDELKQYLLEYHQDDIATAVLRKLLTYSIGRELTIHDRAAVDQLKQRLQSGGYKFQDMIIAICQSSIFQGIEN